MRKNIHLKVCFFFLCNLRSTYTFVLTFVLLKWTYIYFFIHCRGVGFLKYFKPNQLPNFLLAFPILSLAASSIIYYAKLRYVVFITLGFRGHKSTPLDKTSSPLLLYMEADTIPKETNLTGGNTSKIAQGTR